MLRDSAKPNDKFAVINYHKRGWISGSDHQLDGLVYSSKGKVAFKFEGKWSQSVILTDVRSETSEVIWRKNPYTENYQ